MNAPLKTKTTSWRVPKASLAYALLASALVAAPALIRAQSSGKSAGTNTGTNTTSTGTFRARLYEVDGRPYDSQGRNEVLGAALCRKMTPLQFRLEDLPTGVDSPEYIWVMIGGSCNASERRDGLGVDDCSEIAQFEKEIDESAKDLSINLTEQVCVNGNPQIWFLLTNTIPSSETLTQYSAVSIPLDTSAPAPPTNVRGGSAESQITIEWDPAAGTPSDYFVVIETSRGEDAGAAELDGSGPGAEPVAAHSSEDASADQEVCSSTRLVPGQELDIDSPMAGITVQRTGGNGRTYALDVKDLDASSATIAVIAEDLAGNRSVLSNLGCIRIVPTDGSAANSGSAGGHAEPGGICSVQSAARSAWAALPVASALLGLGLRRRARRRS